jgi:hypothetical protein
MSVRKRIWKTAAGDERHAWLRDYTGQSGKRHVKTFARKKDADAFIAKAKVEVREGVHTADSDSVTIANAADLWLTTGAARGLERSTLDWLPPQEGHRRPSGQARQGPLEGRDRYPEPRGNPGHRGGTTY